MRARRKPAITPPAPARRSNSLASPTCTVPNAACQMDPDPVTGDIWKPDKQKLSQRV